MQEIKSFNALETLSKSQLAEFVEVTSEKLYALRNDAHVHISNAVEELCPRPNISNFRILQVRDTNASDFGMEGQLMVYGALNYEGEFVEGNRYLITNVRPRGTSWSRSDAKEGEVFIMAGAGSRFSKRPAL